MNSLYDVYLGDVSSLQGYRCKSLVRDSAPLIVSRFSTSSQSQTDLDLLKVDGYDNIAGSMFQRIHEDPQKVARVVGFYNAFDGNTYSAPIRQTSATLPFGQTLAKAESATNSYISHSYFSTGTNTNYLYRYDAGSSAGTAIALPVAYQNPSIGQISGLCLHGTDYLFMAGQQPGSTALNCYRRNITAGTWQDIGGNIQLFFELRGVLYGSNSAGAIYTVTNEFAAGAATFTLLTQVGTISEVLYDAKEFNGAVYIAKANGIYRFDGVSVIRILSISTTQLQVYNGALYFFSGKWLYRFDGTNVTRVQFFDQTFVDFTATSDYLFIDFQETLGTYETSDKFGTAYTTNDLARHIYTYNGVGFSLLDEKIYTSTTGNVAYSGIWFVGTYIFDLHTMSSAQALYYYQMETLYSSSAVTTASVLEITSSEFDAGFPAISKSFESLQLDFTGIQAGDSIALSFQTYDGKTWSAAQSLGNITSTSLTEIEVTNASVKLFKRLKILLVTTFSASSKLSIKGVSWKYTLQPRMRWRWQITLLASGNGVTVDRANTAITTDSNALTNLITKAIKQKTPLFMLSPDYSIVDAQINNSALSIVIKGQIPIYTDPYNEYPFIAVKNNSSVWEVLRISAVSYNAGTDKTTLTIVERGYYGVTAAQINAGAEFHLAYKVYVTRLLREPTILDENTYAEQTSGESQLQREYMLEVTEV